MNTKPDKNTQNKPSLTAGEIILLSAAILFFLFVFVIAGWFGSTYLPAGQTSAIHSGELEVTAGNQKCTLKIPAGTLKINRPSKGAIGAKYKFSADASLEEPLRFVNCEEGIPNWTINIEAQTTFVGAEVKPFDVIREPAFDRDHFSFNWTFVPEEPVSPYQSHFWLRAIITQQDQTVENWNILVRDFPMENEALFGLPAIFWLIGAGLALIFGSLFLILFLQKRQKNSNLKR